MALRIRSDGTIWCAALNEPNQGDTYIDDALHYEMSVIHKVLVTTENEYHMANKGQWWWKGQAPEGVKIDSYYLS